MADAWTINPKLHSDREKKNFLSDYVQTAKMIGIHNTCEHLLPCLVNCFNCDETIHPDIYDPYAHLLFGNMDELIDYLSRDCRPKVQKKSSDDETKSRNSSGSSFSDYSSDAADLEDVSKPRLSGYYGIGTILLHQIYFQFFEPERYDEILK